jgi:hypothetical protein
MPKRVVLTDEEVQIFSGITRDIAATPQFRRIHQWLTAEIVSKDGNPSLILAAFIANLRREMEEFVTRVTPPR